MKTRTRKLFSVLLLALVAVACFIFPACKDNGGGNGNPPPAVEGPEAGIYYYDAGVDEYTMTLSIGNKFTFNYEGESKTGSYELTGETIKFDFEKESDATVSATLKDAVLVMEYDGASLRFLKKINYAVTFNTNGGSDVPAVNVINGKTVSKPADPTRDGFIFVGWYADSEFNTPYSFGISTVSADTTIYAQWSAVVPGAVSEYTVNYDLNYDGAENPSSQTTIGGKLFDMPTVEREGYEFKGWWLSMSGEGDKLTSKYTEGMVFDANTTLYALWEVKASGSKLSAPSVTVEAGAVRWDAVAGARSYHITVVGPDGTVKDEDTSSTLVNVPFTTYEAGEYVITVKAIATTGAGENDSEAVRYYSNKVLAKVSNIKVIEPSMLIFDSVENAEKYLITIDCGNKAHNHTNFNNGSSTNFNFVNCDMQEGGIKFTVTAVAEGYASSTSDVFVHNRVLAEVSGFVVNEATQTLSWDAVSGASSYMVSVTCGNEAHEHNFVDNGSKTSLSLKECDPVTGGIVVKVYPKAKGYNSPEASSYTYAKANLATPTNVNVAGMMLVWDTVKDATSYEIQIGNQVYTSSTNSFDLSDLDLVEESDYTISVRAKGASTSVWSDAVVARYYDMDTTVSYSENFVSWKPVIGADGYQVQVNDGEIVLVETGVSSAEVTLSKSGTNVVKVRFIEGAYVSDWATTEVYAHAVIFDSLGGNLVEVQYKAVGDKIELPEPEKQGYDFVEWYNTPGGPASNGSAYTDEIFSESGEIVLYAYYSAKEYNVIYNFSDGGTFTESGKKVEFSSDYTLDIPVANDPALVFGGWYSAPYGAGVQYTDEKGNSIAPWTEVSDVELFAFWIDNVLSYTYTKSGTKEVYSVMQGSRISYVTEVTVPAYYNGLPVAMIAGNAFKDCSNIKVINLPDTITDISSLDPFTGCTSLEEVNVYSTNGTHIVEYWSQDGVLFEYTSTANTSSKLALMPLAKTGKYEIPEGVTEIPSNAFAGSALSRVTIASSVTTIGVEAFSGAANLTSVTFATSANEKALTIGARAFANCTSIVKIELPARLEDISLTRYVLGAASGSPAASAVETLIATDAFTGCTSLKEINVASGNKNYKSVDGVLCDASGKELIYVPASFTGTYTIPNGIERIANGAFFNSNITEVIIHNNVTEIGECAFYGSVSLEKVTFKGNGFNNVKIGKYAFRNCSALAQIVFESGNRVSTIGEGAFMDCVELEALDIPANVSTIAKQAFRGCTSIETVKFADNGAELKFGEDAFYGCSAIKEIELPANVSEVPGIFSGCTSLVSVTVAEGSPYFTSVDGVLFNTDKTQIVFFPQGKGGTYELPATVKVIANGVFRDNKNLTKIIINNAIEVIGDEAFLNASNLATVEFVGEETAESLTIGYAAFRGTSVNDITLPAHTKTIGSNAFANNAACDPTSYYSDAFEITLNEGLETIGDYAFYYSYIEYVNIPSTVTSIGNFAFSYTAIEEVEFAENSTLKTIGEGAFLVDYDTYGYFYSIDVPASVESIGAYAFYGQRYLGYAWYGGYVSFGENSKLKVIGAHAFEECSYLEAITIPYSVESIEAYAFYGCRYIEEVIFEATPEGVTPVDLVIGAPATNVYNRYGETVSVSEIGYAFANISYLYSIALPERLVEICEYSFYSSGIESVSFGENSNLKVIGNYAFYYTDLESVTIPKSVQNMEPYVGTRPIAHQEGYDYYTTDGYDRLGIGEGAFYYLYSSLVSVTFEPNGTEPLTIGAYAFSRCRKLTSIELPARLDTYTSYTGEVIAPLANGVGVFEECYSTDYGNLTGLASINVAEGNKFYSSIDGVLYNADKTELLACAPAKVGKVVIPNTVEKIADKAFYDCTGITEIEFTAGGEKALVIGSEAFAKTNVTSIVLPANVVSIGNEAFYLCKNLTTLTISKDLEAFAGAMVSGCANLTAVIAPEDAVNFKSIDGVLYNKDVTELVFYPSAIEATEFTVPETVKVIGEKAFNGNSVLNKVILPQGLTDIKDGAFMGSSVAIINIPNTVTVIGRQAFNNADNLTEITFEQGGEEALVIDYMAFAGSTSLSVVALPERVVSLGEQAFYRSGISSLSFEEGAMLDTIGDLAFYATNLVEIEVPAATTIGDEVFGDSILLTKVTFAEGLISLGAKTFAGCTAIEEVYFPASLTTLGRDTFFEDYYGTDVVATNLSKVTFAEGSNLEVIPVGTFTGSGLEFIQIPASVKEIADVDTTESRNTARGAFEGMTNLRTVVFEDGSKLSNIGNYAFASCTSLEYIAIPTSVTSLGSNAFANSGLKTITIPATVTQLGSELFNGASALEIVKLDTKASYLPSMMFASCTSLTTITIPETVTTIGFNAFYNTSLTSLTVPANVTDLTASGIFSGIDTLEEVEILGNVTVLGESTFSGCSSLTTVKLPSSLKVISNGAFANCNSLTTIELPAGLTTLGNAFAGSGLESYTLEDGNDTFAVIDGVLYSKDLTTLVSYPVANPSTTFIVPKEVTTIGASTFEGMSYLQEVIFEEGGMEELTIGEEAFANCANLKKVVLPERLTSLGAGAFYRCYNLKEINIPDNVTVINENTFYECYSLYKLELNDNITSIGEEAFYYCTNLYKLHVPASLTEIGEDAFYNCNKLFELEDASTLDLANANYREVGYINAYADPYYGAANIYKPGEGETMYTVNPEGFVMMVYDDMAYLVSYNGDETEITIPYGIQGIYMAAFIKSNVTKVTLSTSVTYIMENAFYENDYLTEVVLHGGIETIDREAFAYCRALGSVVVPSTIGYIGSYAFSGCSNVLLLVEAESKPSSWSANWNSGCDTIWGYDGLEHTYTFNTNGANETVDSITSTLSIQIPDVTLTKDGYIFVGWYDNAEFEGSAVSGTYYSKDKTTFYAHWLTPEEYDALFAGYTIDTAVNVEYGKTYTVNIEVPHGGNAHTLGDYDAFFVKVVLTEYTSLTFQLPNGGDIYIDWYVEDGEGGYSHYNYKNFYTDEWYKGFDAGTWYFAFYHWSSSKTGSFDIIITK